MHCLHPLNRRPRGGLSLRCRRPQWLRQPRSPFQGPGTASTSSSRHIRHFLLTTRRSDESGLQVGVRRVTLFDINRTQLLYGELILELLCLASSRDAFLANPVCNQPKRLVPGMPAMPPPVHAISGPYSGARRGSSAECLERLFDN